MLPKECSLLEKNDADEDDSLRKNTNAKTGNYELDNLVNESVDAGSNN